MIRIPSRHRPHQVNKIKPARTYREQAEKLKRAGFSFEAAHYLILGYRPRK